MCIAFLALSFAPCLAEESKRPSFDKVQETVESYFQKQRDRRPGDIISKSEVSAVIADVEKLEWKIPDPQALLDQVLGDQHILVATMRTRQGRRFMEKVSGRGGMYDRLDRISEVSGGSQLIQDLVKLPNGEKYAKPNSGGGVPDLLDLLPKNASGKTRRIPDYDKPTGRLYTVEGLTARLSEIYSQADHPAKSLPKSP